MIVAVICSVISQSNKQSLSPVYEIDNRHTAGVYSPILKSVDWFSGYLEEGIVATVNA